MKTVNSATIAFGSCNKQTRAQNFWQDIEKFQPTHFLWTGDAVYTKGDSLEKLSLAYHNLTTNEFYSKFSQDIVVDGVWDDHDYGVNDAGKRVGNKLERAVEYGKFLAGPHSTINRWAGIDDYSGLHHSADIAIGDVTAKVIFLDTRSFRDDHWIRSLGEFSVKGSAVVASFIRGAYSTLGLGRSYNGEMLGAAQWRWLEETLIEAKEQRVDATIIVSSIQVLTSNSVFESWNHFPVEKRKLFDLLAKNDPNNLVFLSGDVHLGEISQASYTRTDGSVGQWTEITSSGLTHSCSDGITGVLCPIMTALLSQHRRSPDAIYLKRNFGVIEATQIATTSTSTSPAQNAWSVEFSVHALPGNEKVLSHRFVVDKLAQYTPLPPIVSVHYADFPQIPPIVTLVVICLFVSVLRMVWVRRSRKCGVKSD